MKEQDKGNPVAFMNPQLRLYNLLHSGGQWSTIELMKAANIADPRKTISRLRAKGVPVADMWCTGTHGARYKRYFIHGKQ